jgi:putative ABC transport system permease protein
MTPQPPRFPQRFLRWFAQPANIDDLLGDLDERFHLNAERSTVAKAKIRYWRDVFSLASSYAIRKRQRDARSGPYSHTYFSYDMLLNYLKISLRSLYQYKYFSILNAFGLAIGMSVSLLLISIYSYVGTYDDFHTNGQHVYTIASTHRDGVEEADYASAPLALAEKIDEEFAGAASVVRIIKAYDNPVKTEKDNIPVKGYYVDPAFLSVFSFDVIQGNAQSLTAPNHVMITESLAGKLFNSTDVIGKTLDFQRGPAMEITGLLKDHPQNSHLSFEILISLASIPESNLARSDRWNNYDFQYVYVLLKEGSAGDDLKRYLDAVSADVYANSTVSVSFIPQHLREIAAGDDRRQAIGVKWEASGFLLFALFAALILLPACFNYTNISVARALRRAKEIGLRKTMGGAKSQIFLQFLTETIVISLLALVGAILIFSLIKAEFQSMLVAGATLDLSLTGKNIGLFIGFAIVTGIVAGVFPALYFAGLNPIQALKSKVNARGSSLRVRKVLTVFQFAISFGFIVCLVVFSRQYRHSVNFDFGFEKKNIVTIPLQDVDPANFDAHFSRLATVSSISMSSGLPGVNASRTWVTTEEMDSTEVAQLFIDEHFIHDFGVTLIAGKNFPDEPWQHEKFIIVNEEFLNHYQIEHPFDALGRTFAVEGNDLEVIGVVRNFNFEPLFYPIGKFFFRMDPSRFAHANLLVTSNDAFTMFSQFENAWKQLPTQRKFEGRYFESQLNEAYSSYLVLIKIGGFLGVLAITISLLGMLGMVVYTAESKTKEVSIRKVMGASVASITFLLSRDYLRMMIWAILFATPVTAYLLNLIMPKIQYYYAELSFWDILLSSLILLTLGLSAITSQTFKTALTNPAATLRSE